MSILDTQPVLKQLQEAIAVCKRRLYKNRYPLNMEIYIEYDLWVDLRRSIPTGDIPMDLLDLVLNNGTSYRGIPIYVVTNKDFGIRVIPEYAPY